MSTSSQALETLELRRALGHFATGITVVTTVSEHGEPVGTTASAVSALSLEPPLVLVCLARSSETLVELTASGRFAVNILSEQQRHLSDNFARRGDGAQWEDVVHRLGPAGTPRLDGALALLECEFEQCIEGGDHEIVVGRITEMEFGDEALRPLVHFRGAYAGVTGS